MTPRGPGLTRDSPVQQRAPVVIRRLRKTYSEATVALRFSNPLECLVATILSAQCTDERVNLVTAVLFVKYTKPEDYLAVPEEELQDDVRPTGFFRNKTKAIRGACRMIVEEFEGEVPRTMSEILRLPGVARKTANVVLGNSYGVVEGVAVDTHVGRLSRRLGFSASDDADKVELDLMALVPRRLWFDFTYVLIDHGRAICQARLPRCESCPVSELCPSSLTAVTELRAPAAPRARRAR